MSLEAHAFWVTSPGHGEIRREALRPAAPDDVVVHTRWSGISRGTESLVFHGRVPPSEYQRMRAPFQAGDFPAPLKYGYSNVGVVEQGPDGLVGSTVFCLFPHQTRYVVPADAVHVVPAGVPDRRAILAANMETALNGVWDANVLPGDRVAVVGGGTVGCLVAWLAGRIPGCQVQLVDTNPHRADVAAPLGVTFATPPHATAEADVVIHTSGAPAGLDTALGLAGLESVVTEMSWFGSHSVPLPLGEAFHARRLTIRSSQVGRVAPMQRARWTYARRLRMALSLLAEPALDALVTGESSFTTLPETMARVTGSPGDASSTLCHAIRYD
jgi:2-desacetyl-2-hydroxyethyl bacteriochlorophyllide A dehydrogenase